LAQKKKRLGSAACKPDVSFTHGMADRDVGDKKERKRERKKERNPSKQVSHYRKGRISFLSHNP